MTDDLRLLGGGLVLALGVGEVASAGEGELGVEEGGGGGGDWGEAGSVGVVNMFSHNNYLIKSE